MTIAIAIPLSGPAANSAPILGAMQSAAIRLVGQKPAVFFGAASSAKFEMDITDLVNEVAQDIAKYQDWQALTKIATLTGDGASTQVTLPYDYDRQTIDSDIQSSVNRFWGYQHVTNLNDFIFDQSTGFSPAVGGWTIYGGSLQFSPAPTGDAKFPYISSYFAYGADGVLKPQFDADTDVFLLPPRLLTLGLVWRWRENKKLDASGDQEAFIKALDEYAGKDKGSSIIRYGRNRRWPNTVIPYMGVAC